jgi:hypothetical protein
LRGTEGLLLACFGTQQRNFFMGVQGLYERSPLVVEGWGFLEVSMALQGTHAPRH